MNRPLPIYIAVEDRISDAVARRLLRTCRSDFAIGATYMRGGFGYLKNNIGGFNKAARGTPFFVLTDLDQNECPPRLIAEWLPANRHPNLLFRVAVREVEGWLLADRGGFSSFLGISDRDIPTNLDSVQDPKALLLRLAARSRKVDIRMDLVPPARSERLIGPNYNGRLVEYIDRVWDPSKARLCSCSLDRTISSVNAFRSKYEDR